MVDNRTSSRPARRRVLVGADRVEAQDDEFETYARWTREAVESLGPEVAQPAACRGSGSPAALAWLLERLAPGPGELVLDLGGGMGGPADFARERTSARSLVIDPSLEACRSAGRMFAIPAAVAAGEKLPLADGIARVAWSLGVLCTVDDQAGFLAESARVVRAGGLLGLFVLVREWRSSLPDPEGNTFPTPAQLAGLVESAGLVTLEQRRVDEIDDAGPGQTWRDAEQKVEDEVRERHGHEPAYAVAQEQSHRIAALLEEGSLVEVVLTCRV